MVLHEFSPSPYLHEFIRTYRVVHFHFTNNEKPPCKAYPPKPEHCLSFYPYDVEEVEFAETGKKAGNYKAVLFGMQTEVTNRFVGSKFLIFQIVFKPGALFRLTGIPLQEITNEYLDAEIFFPTEIKNINEQLFHCKTYVEMVNIIEAFLFFLVKKTKLAYHRMDTICNKIIFTTNPYSIDFIAKESCLSTRQFERTFKQRMGVSPKYFSKVARFENAFRMKNKFPQLDWLSIALHCGYYDYQHLVKDYKSLTQKTPQAFHEIDLTAPERSFGDVDTY